MTPDQLIALRAVRDGGDIRRDELQSLARQGLIDSHNRLTTKGAAALAQSEDDERGME